MAYELTQSCIDIDAGACGLSSTEKLILITLCRFADDNGENCFPSRETIVQSTGLSLHTVKDRIPSLEGKGWFTTKQKIGQGRYFFLNVEKILGAEKITRVNSAPGVNPTRGNFAPGTKTTRVNSDPTPGAILPPHPGQFCTPTRGNFAPLKEHIKEQIKEQEENKAEGTVEKMTESSANRDFGLTAEETPKPRQKQKAKTFKLPFDAIPEQWEKHCREVRPDLDPKRAFANFRFYFTEGRGAGTRRSERGWSQSWSNWISREKEQTQAAKGASAPLPPHKDPNFHFDDEYYKKSLNPDGTVNWGF